MSAEGPLPLVLRIADMLDDLGIPYALGGSVASSFFGEPRATADIDIAVRLDALAGDALLRRAQADFYVPVDAARRAIAAHEAFNLLVAEDSFKVDLFVLGDGLLDRRQLERRVLVPVPGSTRGIWVTSPEDQIVRKLDWYRQGGSVSDRQWRDIVGILRVRGSALDMEYLRGLAGALDLTELVERAVTDAASTREW